MMKNEDWALLLGLGVIAYLLWERKPPPPPDPDRNLDLVVCGQVQGRCYCSDGTSYEGACR